MNYEDLKEVIHYLKKITKCSECNGHFTDKDISILATLPFEAIFQLNCKKCGNTMLVNIGIKPEREHRSIVTENDVENIRNFLGSFNGDFKKLFNHSKKQ
ncbi:hypothetical protein J7J83_04000 [bacterium]|nr:hypothetical protein [bacterium]